MTQRIYTRTGDAGETGLFGGARVSKADARVNAYGDVDELNAVLGWAITQIEDGEIRGWLLRVQAELFAVGAHLATTARDGRPAPLLPDLPVTSISEMERMIDAAEAEMPPLKSFILPGGGPAGAALHFARTVCRRAERSVVALSSVDDVDAAILTYLNRLSDLLFDLARLANYRAGVAETKWP